MTCAAHVLGMIGLALAATPCQAASILSGAALARKNCASCHAIGPQAPAPQTSAPPFADLQTLFPDKSMEEILALGIMVQHPPMPLFAPRQDALDDLLAYLKSVQRKPAPG